MMIHEAMYTYAAALTAARVCTLWQVEQGFRMYHGAKVIYLEGLGEGDDSRQSSLLMGGLAAQGQVAQRASCVVLHPLLTCTHTLLLSPFIISVLS